MYVHSDMHVQKCEHTISYWNFFLQFLIEITFLHFLLQLFFINFILELSSLKFLLK